MPVKIQIHEKKPSFKLDPEISKKIRERRATKAITPADLVKINQSSSQKKHRKKVFKAAPKWWKKESVRYAFCHPYVRSLLEKLMGSNLVSLTDREYMQRLQERILEDYGECMDKRIKTREREEMERVKNLVLTGIIPLDEAPESMADHPIMIIENYCKKLIAERRAKIKKPKVYIPKYLYYDDTPDPPSGLTIQNGHVFRKQGERLCQPLIVSDIDMGDLDDENGYMLSSDEYLKLKYEDPIMLKLKNAETVELMYNTADEIIGLLQTIDEAKSRAKMAEDLSMLTDKASIHSQTTTAVTADTVEKPSEQDQTTDDEDE